MLSDDRRTERVQLLAAHDLYGQLDRRRKDALLHDGFLWRRRSPAAKLLGCLVSIEGPPDRGFAGDPAACLVAKVLLRDPAALVVAVVCLPPPVRIGRRISRRLDGCREHDLGELEFVSENDCALRGGDVCVSMDPMLKGRSRGRGGTRTDHGALFLRESVHSCLHLGNVGLICQGLLHELWTCGSGRRANPGRQVNSHAVVIP